MFSLSVVVLTAGGDKHLIIKKNKIIDKICPICKYIVEVAFYLYSNVSVTQCKYI